MSHPLGIPDRLPSDYQLLGPLKNANDYIIMPMRGTVECRPPAAADKGEQTISGYEDMFLFKGGKQMSTKIDITLRNSPALSSVVVKSCEIFKCSNCK